MRIVQKLIFLIFLISNIFAQSTQELINNFTPSKEELKDGAVIVERRLEFNLDKNNFATNTIYYLIAILDNKAANDYSHIQSSFNSYYEEHRVDFARVISKNGKVNNLEKDAISVKTLDDNMYSDAKKN